MSGRKVKKPDRSKNFTNPATVTISETKTWRWVGGGYLHKAVQQRQAHAHGGAGGLAGLAVRRRRLRLLEAVRVHEVEEPRLLRGGGVGGVGGGGGTTAVLVMVVVVVGVAVLVMVVVVVLLLAVLMAVLVVEEGWGRMVRVGRRAL